MQFCIVKKGSFKGIVIYSICQWLRKHFSRYFSQFRRNFLCSCSLFLVYIFRKLINFRSFYIIKMKLPEFLRNFQNDFFCDILKVWFNALSLQWDAFVSLDLKQKFVFFWWIFPNFVSHMTSLIYFFPKFSVDKRYMISSENLLLAGRAFGELLKMFVRDYYSFCADCQSLLKGSNFQYLQEKVPH